MSYFRTNIYNSDLFKIPSDWIKLFIGGYSEDYILRERIKYSEEERKFIDKYCSNIYDENYSYFIHLSDLSKEEIETLKGFQRLSKLSIENIRFEKERGMYKHTKVPEIVSFSVEDIERSIISVVFDGNRELANKLYEILLIARKNEYVSYDIVEENYNKDLVNYIINNKKHFNKILEEDRFVFIYDKASNRYHTERLIDDELTKKDRCELIKKYRDELYVDLEELCDKLSIKKSLKLEYQGEDRK